MQPLSSACIMIVVMNNIRYGAAFIRGSPSLRRMVRSHDDVNAYRQLSLCLTSSRPSCHRTSSQILFSQISRHNDVSINGKSSTNDSNSSSSSSRRRALFGGSALIASVLVGQSPPSVARAYDEEDRRIAIFEKTSRSVVFIDTFVERRDSLTTNIMEVPLGSGSGFVWDKQGHIVTNYHVVRNARSAQVAILLSGADAKSAAAKMSKSSSSSSSSSSPTMVTVSTNSDDSTADVSLRQTFMASIVGVDPGKDIAVLKIEADPVFLFPIAVGSSAGIKVGQQAMAIGNPFGTRQQNVATENDGVRQRTTQHSLASFFTDRIGPYAHIGHYFGHGPGGTLAHWTAYYQCHPNRCGDQSRVSCSSIALMHGIAVKENGRRTGPDESALPIVSCTNLWLRTNCWLDCLAS
jgi:hypothetical protein